MKQAIKIVEEIKRCRKAICQTKSDALCFQYNKHIEKIKKELKQYCKFKNIDYSTLWNLSDIKEGILKEENNVEK